MGPDEKVDWSDVRVHIDGIECEGIRDFDATFEPMDEYVQENIKLLYNGDISTLTLKCRVNPFVMFQLIGLWQWIVDYCPNKRVLHLAQYAKKHKIRTKNLYRAMRIIAKTYYRN